jgi:hypothetical protein
MALTLIQDIFADEYRPILSSVTAKPDAQTVKIDEDIGTQFKTLLETMREANRGTTPQAAAKAVNDVMTWQHNVLSSNKLDPDYCPKSNEEGIEKAFLFGLAMMASKVYDISGDDDTILLFGNVIGMYYAMVDSEAISSRFDEMCGAAEIYVEAFDKGYEVMLGYLANEKDDDEKYALTELINEHPKNRYDTRSGVERGDVVRAKGGR